MEAQELADALYGTLGGKDGGAADFRAQVAGKLLSLGFTPPGDPSRRPRKQSQAQTVALKVPPTPVEPTMRGSRRRKLLKRGLLAPESALAETVAAEPEEPEKPSRRSRRSRRNATDDE